MELTQLRYFRAVAEQGSITAAARTLRISQPSVSVAIQKLEGELHTTLLHRSRNGVAVTSTGRELLEYARRIFALAEEAEAVIQGLEHDEVGRFVVGCPEALGAYFLPRFLNRFVPQAPGIELRLWNAPSPRVLRAVLERNVDFGVLVNPTHHPDLVLSQLFEDATDVMVASDAVSAEASFEEAVERLRRGPLLYVDHLPQSIELTKRLAERDLLPERELVCGDLEMVKSLVLADVGVAVIPRRVADYGQSGCLRRLHPNLPFVPDTIYLVYRADLHRTKGAMRLRSALLEHGRAFE